MSAAPTSKPATGAIPKPQLGEGPSAAAEVCWHASVICRSLDHGIEELRAALTEATQHTDALIELAITMTAGADEPPSTPGTAVRS